MELKNKKLSLRDALTIRQETLGTVRTTDQLLVLPYLILQKIMMCDRRCRSCLFKTSSPTTHSNPSGDSGSDDGRLHPVDCMLAVLHCCDDILRQRLFSKLSSCQLAIPFLLPNPADYSITFPLWAMRSLVKSWNSHRTGEKEYRLVDCHIPIVSFMRIGTSQSSKSEILNAVIGGGLEYFFTHRECEGGNCERNFVNGLVEMCCYFPSGKDTDHFTDPVTFLNLRGDAQQHDKQVEFLQNISFMSVVLIAKENINEDATIRDLQSLAEVPESRGIILLLAEGEVRETHDDTKLDSLLQVLPEAKSTVVELKNKDVGAIATEIQKVLREKLDNPTSEHKSIDDCYDIAYEADFVVDEENVDCKCAKWNAEDVVKKLHSGHYNKDNILPLQGALLWCEWAKCDKEQIEKETSSTSSVTDYNAQKDVEKMEIRKKQFNQSTTLAPAMESFMKYLLEENVNKRKYFLHWLKLFLDDHSRAVLPKLLTEYQETKDQLNQSRGDLSELTKKLKIQNEALVNASFSLEHFFREMGQIYMARMNSGGYEVSEALKDEVKQFPQIMAEIMDEGHALELIDGDASHIPLLWVEAVIERLKAVCGKNAREKNGGKLFVLSVLGIQSTGKSTLLNAMFGFCFDASAGRCTRGAYAQLLPLNHSLRQMIDCDYMLVVDTEGLRAPELRLEGLKHDNELATFVMGLANATIINIFGVSPDDLDDVLQTVVHSFICMVGRVDSCLFVHQNVSEGSKIMHTPERQNKLNTRTRAIAKAENLEGHYNSFNQIIGFNDSKDVYSFPAGLWKPGNPPMAPFNVDYCESAQTLKTAIMKRNPTHEYLLETFKLRLSNLWGTAIKNAPAVIAYSELESEYAKWSGMLESKMTEWKNTTQETINGCDSRKENEIKDVAKKCFEKAEEILKSNQTEVLEKMELYFNSSEILSQWKRITKERIKELHTNGVEEAKTYCNGLEKYKFIFIEAENLEETKLDAYIRDLVNSSENDERYYSDDELENMFETKWTEWWNYFKTETEKTQIVTGDNPVLTLLSQKKESCLNQCKEKYGKIRETRETTKVFCGRLKRLIIKGTDQKIVDTIQESTPYLKSKGALNVNVLTDLAQSHNFHPYEQYLTNRVEYLSERISTYIKKNLESLSETVTGTARKVLSTIIERLNEAIEDLNAAKIKDMDEWIRRLHDYLEDVLTFSESDVRELFAMCDFNEFSKALTHFYHGMKGELEDKYKDTNVESLLTQLDHGSSPEIVLRSRLIGCSVECPLCGESCQRTNAGHSDDHSVKVHCPVALKGHQWEESGKLAPLTCPQMVERNVMYLPTEEKSIASSNYIREECPNWYITSSTIDPKYWKHVICKYEKEIVKFFWAEGADIPNDWRNIDKAAAIDSLKLIYDINVCS